MTVNKCLKTPKMTKQRRCNDYILKNTITSYKHKCISETMNLKTVEIKKLKFENKLTYVHERKKLFCDLSYEDLPQQNEFSNRVGEDGSGDLQKLGQLLQKLTVQSLERRTTLFDVVCYLKRHQKNIRFGYGKM